MKLELQKNLRSAAFRLAYVYGIALFVSVSLSIYVVYQHHLKLAEAFSAATHNSIAVRDLRQAIAILNPSIGASFDSVSYRSNNSVVIFALPNEMIEKEKIGSPWTFIEDIKIFSSANKDNTPLGVLKFSFTWPSSVVVPLALWILLTAFVSPIYFRIKINIEKRHSEIMKVRESEIWADIANQVSHDIRSPLGALLITLDQIEHLSNDQKKIMTSIASRIKSIADDLLDRRRNQENIDDKKSFSDSSRVDIKKLVEECLVEKGLEYGPSAERIISSDLDDVKPVNVAVSSHEIARIISNLLNNSLEAITAGGSVKISLRSYKREVVIAITDNGRGMPQEILDQIGSKIITFGKQKGNGLGLYSAKKILESTGNRLEILSEVGSGTMIAIHLLKISGAEQADK